MSIEKRSGSDIDEYDDWWRSQIATTIAQSRALKEREHNAKHERLEELFHDPAPAYGFRDVVRAYRHPFRTDKELGGFSSELHNDMTIKPYLPRKARVFGSGLVLGLAGFGVTVGPHEAMHAVATTAVGGSCEEVVFNRLYGGDVWAAVVPGAKAEVLLPIIGGYVKPVGLDSLAQNLAVNAAPYVLLAPLGIYCAIKARERRSLPLAVLAAGLNAGTIGSELGDTRNMVYHTGDAVAQQVIPGYESSIKDPSFVGLMASFFVASYVVKGIYRLTRGAINDARRMVSAVKAPTPDVA